MRDITTNSGESQNKNQKTTPVIESFFEPNDSSISLPGVVLQIWLGMRDSNPRSWDQNPLPYHLANPQYRTDYSTLGSILPEGLLFVLAV